MSAEAFVNLVLFIIGLFGLIGLLASWPITLLWVILLAIGWGVLVITSSDGMDWT